MPELFPKDEILRRAEAEYERDLARPTSLGEVAGYAHHGGDADAATDEDHALRLTPREHKGPIRGFDLHLVTHSQVVVQPARNQAMSFAFDRDFDTVSPGGRRG